MRRRDARSEWQGWVSALAESGQSVREFAASQGLNASTLAWWRAAFRRETGSAETPTTPRQGLLSGATKGFVPVVVASPRAAASWLEAELPNGVVVRAVGVAPSLFIAALAALK